MDHHNIHHRPHLLTAHLHQALQPVVSLLHPSQVRQARAATAAKGARIEFIDLAKGICILLVVLLHSNILGEDIPNFKAVRMPLYFILSGLFFRDYGNAVAFILKKVNRMVVPFLFFIFLHIGIVFAINIFTGESIDFTWLYKPFTERQYINTPVWFLICLFEVNVLFMSLYRFSHGNMTALLLLCLSCGLGGFALYNADLQLPLHADSALTAMPFFCIGRLLGSTRIFFPNRYDALSLPLGMSLTALSFGIYIFLGANEIDFINNEYTGNLALIYVNSLLFTIGIMLTCKSIGRLPLLSYIGRYSIIVLCLHYIYIYLVCRFLLGPGCSQPTGILPFLIAFPLSVMSIPLCRRYIPKLTAQKDLI